MLNSCGTRAAGDMQLLGGDCHGFDVRDMHGECFVFAVAGGEPWAAWSAVLTTAIGAVSDPE